MQEVPYVSENIVHRFVRQAETFPYLTALVCEEKKIRYGDLLALAKSNAGLLAQRNRAKLTTVAILGTRGIETPLAMISCLLANLPFVVIDASYPLERILDLLRISQASIGLHPTSLLLASDEEFRRKTQSVTWLRIGTSRDERFKVSADNLGANISVDRDQTAYLLFTSGSTGVPKGIRTGHAPLLHFIDWYQKTFGPEQGSKFSMLSGLSHDPVLRDIFVPLSWGGELHIPKQEYLRAPDQLFDWIESSHIEYSHLTPQLVDLLSARRERHRTLESLRYVFCGGDVLRPTTAQTVRTVAPNAILVNFYGTSETPQAMAYQVIEPELSVPYPIGRPISEVQISIRDENLNPTEAGQQGEIVIETEFLSLGYITQLDGQSRDVFLKTDSDPHNPTRMYLTGDVGYIDAHGRIYFCGRKDDQVKIRGYRVDCNEVAAAIERQSPTTRAVVLPETSETSDTILVAYVAGGRSEIKQEMQKTLPSYMVPGLVVNIDHVPLLANGKVDRAALRKTGREAIRAKTRNIDSPDNKFLSEVAGVWSGLEFDPRLSFVELGGDSLSYVRISLVVEEHLGFLPEKWETTPFEEISHIAAQSQTTDGNSNFVSLVQVESALIFRAISITLVVLDHAKVGFFTATSTLFVISGMSFARFMLPGILSSGRLYRTFGFVTKFAIPAGLWQIFRGGPEHHIWIPDVILLGTLFANPVEGSLPFWFLDILAASFLIFSGLAGLAGKLRRSLDRTATFAISDFSICLSIFALGTVALFVQTQLDWWNGELTHTSVGPFRWFWLLPFGAAIQTAESIGEKWLLTAISIALAIIFYGDFVTVGFFGQAFSTFLFISVGTLIWCNRIVLPKILRRGVALLAQHSLFIYMFSGWVANKLMPKLGSFGVPSSDVLCVILAFIFGITASILWNEIVSRAFALLVAARSALHQYRTKGI